MSDDIVRMARVADPLGESGRLYQLATLSPETLKQFAALVAAAEQRWFVRIISRIEMPAETRELILDALIIRAMGEVT